MGFGVHHLQTLYQETSWIDCLQHHHAVQETPTMLAKTFRQMMAQNISENLWKKNCSEVAGGSSRRFVRPSLCKRKERNFWKCKNEPHESCGSSCRSRLDWALTLWISCCRVIARCLRDTQDILASPVPLDGQNRQSPFASVQRTQSTLASHSAVPHGTNTTPTNTNRAIRIAAQRTQGLLGPNSVS